MTPAGAWTKAFAALLAAAIVIPVLAVAPLAFSKQSFLQLPPHDWSLRWWEAFFADASWFRALMTSFEVATLSCLLSVAAGTSAALGLPRLGPRMRTIASGLFLGPLVAPVITATFPSSLPVMRLSPMAARDQSWAGFASDVHVSLGN